MAKPLPWIGYPLLMVVLSIFHYRFVFFWSVRIEDSIKDIYNNSRILTQPTKLYPPSIDSNMPI